MLRSLSETDKGVVFECQNELGVAEDQRTKLTVDGIAAVDWGTEWSWDSSAAAPDGQEEAERAFELIQQLDTYGGYGVVYTEKFSDVAIGRVTPDCIYYDKIRTGPSNEELKKCKTVRFDEWAVMEGKEFREDFSDLHQAFMNDESGLNPNYISTMNEFNNANVVIEAFARLDLAGRLQKRG